MNARIGNKQSGASAIVVIIFLVMASICSLIALKLYPPMYQHWQIKNIIETLLEEDNTGLRVADFEDRFEKRLNFNNIRNFDNENDIEFYVEDNNVEVYLSYEVRVNVYDNIDAIIKFDDEYQQAL